MCSGIAKRWQKLPTTWKAEDDELINPKIIPANSWLTYEQLWMKQSSKLLSSNKILSLQEVNQWRCSDTAIINDYFWFFGETDRTTELWNQLSIHNSRVKILTANNFIIVSFMFLSRTSLMLCEPSPILHISSTVERASCDRQNFSSKRLFSVIASHIGNCNMHIIKY